MAKLKLERVDDSWVFAWPKEKDKADDLFFEGLDCLGEGDVEKARVLFKKALEVYPEHIDVLHHLGFTSETPKEGVKLNDKAVEVGFSAFPDEFKDGDLLEWGWTENRPFLRAFYNQALLKLDRERGEAISIFKKILSMNPNDNQGARTMLADMYIYDGSWKDMIELFGKYEDDYCPYMLLGSALALFRVGKKDEAVSRLKKFRESFPKCYDILFEVKPKKPKSAMPGYISVGGDDQAYEFWRDMGEFWREEGNREFLEMA